MRIFLWLVLAASLACALWVTGRRHALESRNRSVEIVMDLDTFGDYCLRTGESPAEAADKFRALGVISIAPSETTLEKLREAGKILWIRAEEAPLHQADPIFSPMLKEYPHPPLPSMFVAASGKQTAALVGRALENLLGKGRFKQSSKGFWILGKSDDLTQMPLGMNWEEVNKLAPRFIGVDPRLENLDAPDSRGIDYLLSNAGGSGVDTIIFTGLRNEVLGYDAGIPRVARFFRGGGLNFGFIETYEPGKSQKGSEILARLLPGQVVKVQGLVLPPFTRFDPEKAAETFLLGVRERNVRIVYFRPFLINYGGESLWETNARFLESLTNGLKSAGFAPGPANPFPFFTPGRFLAAAAAVGMAAGAFLLISLFVEWPLRWAPAVFAAVAALFMLPLPPEIESLLRSAFAFWGGVLFPILGLALFFPKKPAGVARSLGFLFSASLVTLAGAVLASALALNNETLLGVTAFRGVKGLLVIPVILGPWLAYVRRAHDRPAENLRELFGRLFEPWKKPVKFYHAAGFLILAASGMFMLLRSGNTGGEGVVPGWEKSARFFLEGIFSARPRFKEFAIGHPFFMAACGLGVSNPVGVAFLILGSLGQADMVDSFAHLHTPLSVTLLRTFHGLWIGAIFGCLLNMASRRMAGSAKKGSIGRRGEMRSAP